MPEIDTHSVDTYIKQNVKKSLDRLMEWLSIPSISSEETHKQDMYNSAKFLETELKNSGLTTEIIELGGGANPVVYAEKIVNPNLPTVIVYGHYDVQPINKPKKWHTEPFKPTVSGGKMFGRGTSDDKGQIWAHVMAVDFFSKSEFPCNIKFLVEGDEEHGVKKPFDNYVTSNPEKLAADVVLVSDTNTLEEGTPALSTSLKGIIVAGIKSSSIDNIVEAIHRTHDAKKNNVLLKGFYDRIKAFTIGLEILKKFGEPEEKMGPIKPEFGYVQLYHRWYRPTNSPLMINYANKDPLKNDDANSLKITAMGPNESLHSGQFGGPVIDPVLYLSHLLVELKEKGVDYDIDFISYNSPHSLTTTMQPTAEAQITVDKKKNDIDDLLASSNLEDNLFKIEKVEDRLAYLEQIYSGEGQYKDFRFGDGKASAVLSFRIVPHQDGNKIYQSVEALVKDVDPGAEVKPLMIEQPFTTDPNDRYSRVIIEGLKQGYNSQTVHLKAIGGSIPITHTLQKTLNAPVILVGISPPDSANHAPNEMIGVKDIVSGAKSMIYALQNIR